MPANPTTTRPVPRPAGDAKLVRYDEYIDKQIRTTIRAVKAVDFATALVVLAAGVLAFLFVAAVVEHWLVPSGFNFAERFVLFGLLVGGVGYFSYRRLWPLCLRAINPVYAAQTIEHGTPSLKNSLINLLLFRQHRGGISDAVYQTLEEQAAQRLTRAPTESAVDRTHLIRFGYVLLAVVAAGALYKVFSPKDPFIAAERVLMPWADIVPASRVSIAAVEPGSVKITRGEFLDVSAEVRGIGDDDPVWLRFTTADGRAVDKSIRMKASNSGSRYVGRLPDSSDASGSVGVAKNLTYRIEAGDARTLDYPVTVVTAPAILVDRIDYDYPAYTGYVDQSIEGLGDIRAIEGTRVTIRARANVPIESADVDFDADGRRDLRMSIDGERAWATFELSLREDRQTPRHLSYVLRLTTNEGQTNRNPVKHPIDVVPDYAPEVAIVSPPEKLLELRLDDSIVIEAEANDPDFALASVQLRGEAPGRPKIDIPLLADEQRGKVVGRYRFSPVAHKLKAGDIVQYWVTAGDIRAPKPNSTATEKRTFRIVSPDAAQQPPQDRIAQRDQRRQPDGQGGGQGQQQQQDGGQGQQSGEGNQGGDQAQQQPNASGKPQGGNRQSQNRNQQDQKGQSGQQDGQAGQSDGQQQQGQQNGSDQRQGQQSGESGAAGKESESAGKEGQGNPSGSQGGAARSPENNSQQSQDGKQTGAGAAGGEASQQGSQPAGARPDQKQRSRNEGHKGQPSSAPESKPVSPEGDDDGAAFDRIREHMQRSGELKPNDGEQQSGEQQSGERQNGKQQSGKQQNDGQQNGERQSGERQSGEQQSGEQTSGERGSDGKQSAAPGDKSAGEKPHDKGTEDSPAGTEQPSGSAKSNDPKGEPKQQPHTDGQATQAEGAADQKPRTDDQGEGRGADTRQDDVPGREKPPAETGEQTKSPGGQQTSTKGPSGAGDQPAENQGVPDSKQGMKPSDKRQPSPSDNSKRDDKEPPAPGEGKRESDSQGELGGDRPGGGQEGGGQKANRDGTGSAGQNQSADEGAGESSEKGAGKSSPNAGQDATANHRTGQPGSENKQGPGSSQRDGQGKQPGGERGGKDGGKDGGGDAPARSENQQSKDSNEQRNNSERGTPTGGGGGDVGAGPMGPSSSDGTAPDGDAANLDYARKQTDLVLDKLAEQLNRQRVDDRMLKELGWSEDDLRAFVKRWQERKEAARKSDPSADAARRDLDDALRSLGLRRGTLRQNKVDDDRQRDLREGYRGPVPPEYQERLRAYNQGVSRARQDAE